MALKLLVLFALSLAVVALPAAAADPLQRARDRGTLVAITFPGSAQGRQDTTSSQVQGFDIAVADEIAARLGLPVRHVAPGWDEIIAGNWRGRWDYAVASITPTEPREKNLLFPAIYRFDAAALVVRKDDPAITRPADASGRTIGVRRGTTFENYLRRNLVIYGNPGAITYLIDNPQIRVFEERGEVIDALVARKVDAIVTSLGLIEASIRQGAPVRVVPGFLFFEPVAVAVDRQEPALAKRVGEAVVAMRSDGTLTRLSEKWFGVDVAGIIP